MKILLKWIILINLEKFSIIKLWNYEFFCHKNKIDEFFSFNEIIEIIWEIINNNNYLINIDDSDQMNLKIKIK